MRQISAASLAKLAQTHGTEPINIVEIDWVIEGLTASYADRDLGAGDAFAEPPIKGKILDIGGLDDAIQVSQGASSAEITIKLDDTDGSIKSILDNNDIHKRPCRVYQWFDGIALNEKFLVFQGQISSPITWKEGDRTVSFSVITKLEDTEVGFSPEEGQFPAIPKNLIGQPWPMCFGTVIDLKGIAINEAADATLAEGTGIRDFTIPYQIGALNLQDGWLSEIAFYWAVVEGVLLGAGATDAAEVAHQNQLAAVQTQIQVRAQRIELDAALDEQISFEISPVRVIGSEEFPQNQTIDVTINEGIFRGYFSNGFFYIIAREHPEAQNFCSYRGLFDGFTLSTNSTGPNEEDNCRILPHVLGGSAGAPGADVIEGEQAGFFWAEGGAQIKIYGGEPVDYVISIVPGTVRRVMAKQAVEGSKRLVVVPDSYYTVETRTYGTIQAVIVTLNRALSSIEGEGWEDGIYVTFESDVGPNTVDILEYLIDLYLPDLTIDAASFAHVKTALENYPSDFAILDRKNILMVLQEIAFQARCAIWVSADVIYLRYLSEEPESVLTITESDIDFDGQSSVEVFHTETEDLVTKYTGTWRASYAADEPNKVILRHNVKKYGTLEREDDYYIYNRQELVIKSMTFWLIRFANTWKKMRFTTSMHTLLVETMDAVTLNFSGTYVANEAIKALVEKAEFDSNSKLVNYEVWTPVKAGTMVAYDFAWPAAVDQELIFPTVEEETAGFAGGGGPGAGATGQLQTGWIEVNNNRTDNRHDYGDQHPSDIGDETGTPAFPPIDTGVARSNPGLVTPTYQQNPLETAQSPYFINLRETSIYDPSTGQSAKLDSFFRRILNQTLQMDSEATISDGTNTGEFVFTWNDDEGKFVPDVAELKDD